MIIKRQLLSSSPVWWSLIMASRSLAWHSKTFPRFQACQYSNVLWHQPSSLTGRFFTVSRPASLSRTFFSHESDLGEEAAFSPGDRVQVEVVSFGPLGASVEVIGKGHDQDDLIPPDAEPLTTGLILQKEISYFRQARDNVDVVRGEILPAFVQNVRDDGKVDIGLRSFGGKAKAQEVGEMIIQQLEWSPDGSLPVGDKSTPKEISEEFPGVSKSAFKKAVGALYKKGLVQPTAKSITLMKRDEHK